VFASCMAVSSGLRCRHRERARVELCPSEIIFCRCGNRNRPCVVWHIRWGAVREWRRATNIWSSPKSAWGWLSRPPTRIHAPACWIWHRLGATWPTKLKIREQRKTDSARALASSSEMVARRSRPADCSCLPARPAAHTISKVAAAPYVRLRAFRRVLAPRGPPPGCDIHQPKSWHVHLSESLNSRSCPGVPASPECARKTLRQFWELTLRRS